MANRKTPSRYSAGCLNRFTGYSQPDREDRELERELYRAQQQARRHELEASIARVEALKPKRYTKAMLRAAKRAAKASYTADITQNELEGIRLKMERK